MLCECGEFVQGETFKDYIKTSSNPSTPTIGHVGCGLIFDFIDGEKPKRYSSKKELKIIALKFANKIELSQQETELLLLEVHRLKTEGTMSDAEILFFARKKIK